MIRVMLTYFVFKQKTAYELRISDWSSDVCSSDRLNRGLKPQQAAQRHKIDGPRRAAMHYSAKHEAIRTPDMHAVGCQMQFSNVVRLIVIEGVCPIDVRKVVG